MPYLVLHVLSAAVCAALTWDTLTRSGSGALRLALPWVAGGAGLAILGLLMAAVEPGAAAARTGIWVTRVGIGSTAAGAAGLGLVLLARPGSRWPGWATAALAVGLGVLGGWLGQATPVETLVRTQASWFAGWEPLRLFDSGVIAGGSVVLLAGALFRLRRTSPYGRGALWFVVLLQLGASALYFCLRWSSPPEVLQAFSPVLVAATGVGYAIALRAWRVAGLNGSALTLLFRRMPTPSVIIDLYTDLVLLNPAARVLLGWDELAPDTVVGRLGLGRSALEALERNADRTVRSVRLQGCGERVFDMQCCFDRKAAIGLFLLQEVTERVAHAERLGRTLAELRAMQERLVMQEKMAALGVLVAGVNHEINNPLAYVTANLGAVRDDLRALLEGVELARDAAAGKPGAVELLGRWAHSPAVKNACADGPDAVAEALGGCAQMRDTVASMRLLSRRDAPLQRVDFAELVRAGARIGRTGLKSGVALTVQVEATLPVHGVGGDLTRVVTNLVVNAGQALGESGHIQVRGWGEGDWALLEVADDGPGVPETLRQRIFEPFFTTKPPGQGTGLGLAVSYETARRHGGELRLVSGPGEGARFQLRLPLAPGDAPHDDAERLAPLPDGESIPERGQPPPLRAREARVGFSPVPGQRPGAGPAGSLPPHLGRRPA